MMKRLIKIIKDFFNFKQRAVEKQLQMYYVNGYYVKSIVVSMDYIKHLDGIKLIHKGNDNIETVAIGAITMTAVDETIYAWHTKYGMVSVSTAPTGLNKQSDILITAIE